MRGAGPGLRPGGMGRPMGAPPPPPPSLGPTRRKKAGADGEEIGAKKKTTGKRGKSERPQDVDNELFTKGPFSGTQIIADDLGPDIVMPEPSDEEATALQRSARQQGVKVVFVQPQIASRGAEAVARAIGARVEILDPLAPDVLENLVRAARAIAASYQ